MTTKIGSGEQAAACDAIVDRLDAGAGPGRIDILDGARPANISDASPGTVLASPTFAEPAFGAANASGVATANAIVSDTAAANSGTATHARCFADGAAATDAVIEMLAGESDDAPTPQLIFDDAVIVAGGTVAISSFTFTVPGA